MNKTKREDWRVILERICVQHIDLDQDPAVQLEPACSKTRFNSIKYLFERTLKAKEREIRNNIFQEAREWYEKTKDYGGDFEEWLKLNDN